MKVRGVIPKQESSYKIYKGSTPPTFIPPLARVTLRFMAGSFKGSIRAISGFYKSSRAPP